MLHIMVLVNHLRKRIGRREGDEKNRGEVLTFN